MQFIFEHAPAIHAFVRKEIVQLFTMHFGMYNHFFSLDVCIFRNEYISKAAHNLPNEEKNNSYLTKKMKSNSTCISHGVGITQPLIQY